jgi:hypothetical protein
MTALASYACEVNTPGSEPYSSWNRLLKNSWPGPAAVGAVPVTLPMSLPTWPGRSGAFSPSVTKMGVSVPKSL